MNNIPKLELGMKKKNGQVLILVLLVVIVALAVGLSVASRNITNLKTSTQSEHSQRAFSAAEGGIEQVLSQSPPTSQIVQVGGLEANVVVDSLAYFYSTIDEGNVGQVNLDTATGTGIQIEWAESGNSQEDPDLGMGGFPASLEITIIRGLPGSYTQERFAWIGISHGTDQAGFIDPVLSCTPTGFKKCGQITLGSNPVLLRIRPFWNRATVRVTSVGGTLPSQMYDVTSTASTELGVTRKIQITKSVQPQLPAVFDYVLYSEGNIEKQ